MKISTHKKDFYVFIPNDDLQSFNLKLAPPVACVQGYYTITSTKFELSMAL